MKKSVVISVVASVVLFGGLVASRWPTRPVGEGPLLAILLGRKAFPDAPVDVKFGIESVRVKRSVLDQMELFANEQRALASGFGTDYPTFLKNEEGFWEWNVTRGVQSFVGEQAWSHESHEVISDVRKFFQVANGDKEPEDDELLTLLFWAKVFGYPPLVIKTGRRLIADVTPQRVQYFILRGSDDTALELIGTLGDYPVIKEALTGKFPALHMNLALTKQIQKVYGVSEEHFVIQNLDHTATLWNAQTGQQVPGFQAQNVGEVYRVGQNSFVIKYQDYTATLWNAKTGQQVPGFQAQNVREAYRVGQNSFVIKYQDYTATLWNAKTGQQVPGFQAQLVSRVVRVDKERFVIRNLDNTVTLWNAQTGQQLQDFLPQNVNWKDLYRVGEEHFVIKHQDYTATIWNAQTGQQVPGFQAQNVGGVYRVGQERFVIWYRDFTAKLWNAQTGQQFPGFQRNVLGVDRVGQERFVIWYRDFTAKLWNAQTGQQIHEFQAQNVQRVYRVYRVGEEHFVILHLDGTATLWDLDWARDLTPEQMLLKIALQQVPDHTEVGLNQEWSEVYQTLPDNTRTQIDNRINVILQEPEEEGVAEALGGA